MLVGWHELYWIFILNWSSQLAEDLGFDNIHMHNILAIGSPNLLERGACTSN